jgi:membrane protein implicated in regulation of membrane protease activity
MHVVWWYWICLGLFLLLAEMMSGGFYLFFIGIAALATGAFALGVHTAWVQLALFALLATVLIVTLRKPLVDRVRKTTRQADVPEFIGETGRAVEPIAVGKDGKIELRGSIWAARNGGTADMPQNSPCTITAREGLKMVVTLKQ